MIETAVGSPHEFFLDNGLKVVLVQQAAAPVATLLVAYRIGSRNEAVGYTGAAHLLEHMLFKGTPANNRKRGRAFADIMNEIGANKNATTWHDRTLYFETVPTGFLDFAIELEADRMRNAYIADVDRRSEMTVVRNELERNDGNSVRVLNMAVVATAFREHPYHHPTIGWRSDVEGVSTDRLRALYDGFYHPDNATVFVVGDFDPARTRDAIERRFGTLPRAPQPIPEVYTDEPAQAGERTVTVKRPGDTTLVQLVFHTPAAFGQARVLSSAELRELAASGTPLTDDPDALEVLARILGHGRTSRLSRALVDTGLALDASASDWGSRDPGLFQIAVTVRPGVEPGDVRAEIERVLAAIGTTGPSADEVERAQSQIAVARAFAYDGSMSLVQRLAELEMVGSWRLDDTYLDRISAVTSERVRDVARTYLHEDNRTLGVLVPGTARTFDVVPFEAVAAKPEAGPAPEIAPLPAPLPVKGSRFADRIASGALANGVRFSYVETPARCRTTARRSKGVWNARVFAAPTTSTTTARIATMRSHFTFRRRAALPTFRRCSPRSPKNCASRPSNHPSWRSSRRISRARYGSHERPRAGVRCSASRSWRTNRAIRTRRVTSTRCSPRWRRRRSTTSGSFTATLRLRRSRSSPAPELAIRCGSQGFSRKRSAAFRSETPARRRSPFERVRPLNGARTSRSNARPTWTS